MIFQVIRAKEKKTNVHNLSKLPNIPQKEVLLDCSAHSQIS